MNIGDTVKLSKIEAFNPEEPFALPIPYTVEGSLLSQIRPNIRIVMLRTKRNDVERDGIFTSSPIKRIEGDKIYTENSVWQIEVLEGAKKV